METLLGDSSHGRVRCIDSQGDGSSGFGVSKDRNSGQEELGALEGGVEHGGL